MHCCAEMKKYVQENEVQIVFIPKFREYGIPYSDGGSSVQLIGYCPWCGSPLPKSLRHEWSDAIETMGLEPDDDNIPGEYLSEEWYDHVIINKGKKPPGPETRVFVFVPKGESEVAPTSMSGLKAKAG